MAASSELNESLQPKRMPDALSEAMIATAAGYLVAGSTRVVGSENALDFRQTFHNFYEDAPVDGRAILAAGLRAAEFSIQLDPVLVSPPAATPEEVLDTMLLMENGCLVAPTIIDMGIRAMTEGSAFYDQKITDFAVYEVG